MGFLKGLGIHPIEHIPGVKHPDPVACGVDLANAFQRNRPILKQQGIFFT